MRAIYFIFGLVILLVAFESTKRIGPILLGLIVLGALIVAEKEGKL